MKTVCIVFVAGIVVATSNAIQFPLDTSKTHSHQMNAEDKLLVDAINERMHHLLGKMLHELDYRVRKHLKHDQEREQRNHDEIFSWLKHHDETLREVLHECSEEKAQGSYKIPCVNCDDKGDDKKLFSMRPSAYWS